MTSTNYTTENSFFESLFEELVISNEERKYPQFQNPIKQFFVRVLKFMDSKVCKKNKTNMI